jgi:hypothetical protein
MTSDDGIIVSCHELSPGDAIEAFFHDSGAVKWSAEGAPTSAESG